MLDPKQCVLFSGGAAGTEQFFGAQAEAWGIEEVNYSFDGHQIERKRGVRVLTSEELALKDVSLTYVSRLMGREFTKAPLFRKVLQSICWQVSSGQEVVVVGNIQPDQTVKGGTGWGAEFAKICNKPLLVFDQEQDGWYRWLNDAWVKVEEPVIEHTHFTATGTRFMEANGRKAISDLFARSFNRFDGNRFSDKTVQRKSEGQRQGQPRKLIVAQETQQDTDTGQQNGYPLKA